MKNEEIKMPNLILCEGKDAYYFIIYWLNNAFVDTPHKYQAIDFGGNSELSKRIGNLLLSKASLIKSILIIRDAESDYDKAVNEVNKALENNSLIPNNENLSCNQICDHNNKKIAFTLFPSLSDKSENGTLEDFYIKHLKNPKPKDILNKIDCFTNSLNKKFNHPHKTKLHTYFSVSDFVGDKLGEATKKGAFNFECDELINLKKLLIKLANHP